MARVPTVGMGPGVIASSIGRVVATRVPPRSSSARELYRRPERKRLSLPADGRRERDPSRVATISATLASSVESYSESSAAVPAPRSRESPLHRSAQRNDGRPSGYRRSEVPRLEETLGGGATRVHGPDPRRDNIALVVQIKELLTVPAPLRRKASRLRNPSSFADSPERLDVHFHAARLVGEEGQPAPVGRPSRHHFPVGSRHVGFRGATLPKPDVVVSSSIGRRREPDSAGGVPNRSGTGSRRVRIAVAANRRGSSDRERTDRKCCHNDRIGKGFCRPRETTPHSHCSRDRWSCAVLHLVDPRAKYPL